MHGRDPFDRALELLLQKGGTTLLLHTFENYSVGDLDVVYQMLTNRNTVCGIADGGAHVGLICDSGSPTSLLTLWARDRTRGPRAASRIPGPQADVRQRPVVTACTTAESLPPAIALTSISSISRTSALICQPSFMICRRAASGSCSVPGGTGIPLFTESKSRVMATIPAHGPVAYFVGSGPAQGGGS